MLLLPASRFLRASVEDRDGMARLEQVTRHGVAHGAKTDECSAKRHESSNVVR